MPDRPDAHALHPLDPLTEHEIQTASATILAAHPELREPRFPLLTLDEPPKDVVLDWRPGDPTDRRAFAVVLDRDGGTHEAVVHLGAQPEVVGWTRVPGVQPSVLFEEVLALQEIVRADAASREALAARGVTDLGLLVVEPWTAGTLPVEGVEPDRRLLRATALVRDSAEDNPYAHPIENLVFVVDLIERRVVKLIDEGPIPIPRETGNYDVASVGAMRTDLRPVHISQPEGISFTIDGNRIRWQRWSLHASVHAVEGLVLHDVRYEDGGRERSILYRGGLSEMAVPYGNPSPVFGFRSVFDAGEYNLGRFVTPLRLGCDCLGEIRYLDAVLADERGEPMTIPNAICVHEEDVGVLWKHWDFLATEEGDVRRSRRLVVSTWHTVGNYEYGFFWYLYLDGTIGFEVKLTGIVATTALPDGVEARFGTEVAPRLEAPNHQHLFCMRLDLDVDGTANTVYEVDAVGLPPGEENPYGTAFVARQTPIAHQRDGGRSIDPSTGRFWKVVNPAVRNRLGQPVGYKLVPHQGPLLVASPDSHVGRRAGSRSTTCG